MDRDVLHVRHDEAVADAFPGHRTGLLRVTADAGPIVPAPGALEQLAEQTGAPGALERAEQAAVHWRDVFARMGAKPKYVSSVERLLELRRAGGAIDTGLPLVDLYCWYSLATGVPIGGYRVARVEGTLTLGLPGKGMSFTPMGATRGSPERTRGREVAFFDEAKVLCRYWNFRDCDETKLGADLDDVLFVFDCWSDAGSDDDAAALVAGLAALVGADASRSAVIGPDGPLEALLAR